MTHELDRINSNTGPKLPDPKVKSIKEFTNSQLQSGSEAIDASAERLLGATMPSILLTHVPLYRPPDTDCGILRERGKAISVAAGYQYQNVLTTTISADIVNKIGAERLTQIYSGDDHDYCEIDHREFTGSPNEITVKSMSWAMGVRRPGFLAVSLWNPIEFAKHSETQRSTPKGTIQNRLCLLPDQLHIFVRYALMLLLTLVVLAVRAVTLSLRKDSPDSSANTLLPLASHRSKSPVSNARSHAFSHSSNLPDGHNVRRTPRSRSPAASKFLGGYGNLPASSRSSSPVKQDVFAPAPYIATDRGKDDSDDEWGMPNTLPRKRRRKSVPLGFLGNVRIVAVPVLLFYGLLIWLG